MNKQLVPFRRWHIAWLQSNGGGCALPFDVDTLMTLEKQNTWTAAVDGDPIACGGTIQQWPGRHHAWSLMNELTGPHMGFLTKAAKQRLSFAEGRIELTVRADFAQGHRWAKLLGFQVETPVLVGYGPQGENHVGYVRFNKG